MENDDLKEPLKKLEDSLIYSMSLGSRELYHSNVWAWLMEKDSRYIKIFFDDYDEGGSQSYVQINREFKHFDLSFEINSDIYVIENKIKSLPSFEQLERYNKTIKDFGKNKSIHKLLVVLINLYSKDDKEQIKELGWNIIEYKDVAERIENFINLGYTDKFSKTSTDVIKIYYNQISTIYSVIKDKLEKDKGLFTYKESLDLGNTLIRLDDVYKKLKGWDVYNYIKGKLDKDKDLQNRFEDYELYTNQSFNNKKVTLDFRWAHKDELHDKNGWNGKRVIGIQIEELDYRFVYGVPADKQKYSNLNDQADDVFKEPSSSEDSWFDGEYDNHQGKLFGQDEYPTSLKVTKGKLYNKYLGDQIFIYQYYNLPGKDKKDNDSPLTYEELYNKVKSDLFRAADIIKKMPQID